jgi:mono/diheme cytochrome c family protein
MSCRTAVAAGLLVVALSGAHPAVADDKLVLPEGVGKAEVTRACTQCHSADNVVNSRRTRAQWESKIDQMIARGATVSDEEIEVIAGYLAEHFGPDTGNELTKR